MSRMCNKSDCSSLGTKFCGACGDVSYCSVECQKEDWKVHKSSCMDKLPLTFLTMPQVRKYHAKVFAKLTILKLRKKNREASNLLHKLLVFVEHQLGVSIEGSSCYKRTDGEEVDNMILIMIRIEIMYIHYNDFDAAHLIFIMETRQLFQHQDKKDDMTLYLLADIERTISFIHSKTVKLASAEYHCEQSLMFARLIKDESRITSEFKTLMYLTKIRVRQQRLLEAIGSCEEAYTLASKFHELGHPDVRDAASMLVDLLIKNGDFSRADDYCRISYESLINPHYGIDSDSFEVAEVMCQLAAIWIGKVPVGDVRAVIALAEEAEDMARKSCKIMDNCNNDNSKSRCYTRCYNILCNVLFKREKFTEETRIICERSIALYRQSTAPFDLTISALRQSIYRLAKFHEYRSVALPDGEERIHHLKLRDKYLEESSNLSVEGWTRSMVTSTEGEDFDHWTRNKK